MLQKKVSVPELGLWNSLPTVALASGGERACVAETAMGIIIRQSLWLKLDICSTNPWNWVTGSWDHEIAGIIYSSGPLGLGDARNVPKYNIPRGMTSWGRDHWILCRITSCESTAKPMNRKVIQQVDQNGSWRQSLLMMILMFQEWILTVVKTALQFASLLSYSVLLWDDSFGIPRPFSYQSEVAETSPEALYV